MQAYRMAVLAPETPGLVQPVFDTDSERRRRRWIGVPFLCFLFACASFMVWFSAVKLMAFDEMLSLYTESASTTAAVLNIQRSSPVSLDPPLYHLLGHWVLALGVSPVFAVRLPSLIGGLSMIACVYTFTRRLAGIEAAALSVTCLILSDIFHMVEGRPYGLLLGISALALLLWQNIVRDKSRTASLAGLFFALGFASSIHYFGILIAVPFLVAECFRTRMRVKLDPPLLAALLGSYLFAIGWLPFLKGAHQYKTNYYIKVQPTDFARAYTSPLQSMLANHTSSVQWIACISVLLLVMVCAYLGYNISRPRYSRGIEWIAIVTFALLPLFGVTLAAAASGAFESRYVVEFSIGIAIALSAGLTSLILSPLLRSILLASLCLLTLGLLARGVIVNDANFAALFQSAQQLDAHGLTLIADKEEFLCFHFYMRPRPGVANAVWVADMNREILASGTDNIDRTMLNLKSIAGLPVIPYSDLQQRRGIVRLIETETTVPPNWIEDQLRKHRAVFILTARSGHDLVYQVELPSQ